MTKKTTIRLLIILLVAVVLILTAFFADVSNVMAGKVPVFSITKNVYEDGGTVEYVGLGYKIFDYKINDGKNKVEFGTIFKSYSDK